MKPRPSLASHRAGKRERGSAIIEFSLLCPVLFVLALGVADFSRAFYASIAVNNAARAGAQYAVREKYTDVAGIKTAAVDDANLSGFTTANVTPAYYCQCPGTSSRLACSATLTCAGGLGFELYVDIKTNYTFTTLVRYPGVPSSVTLNGRAQMRER